MRTIALPAFVLALSFSSAAFAADLYVDASAAAGGTGSSSAPFQTIGAAVAVLARGDTVWVASGTYPEVVTIPALMGSGTTTLRAQAGATVVIDGTSGSQAAGYVVETATPDTTFQGLTVTNGVGGALGIQFYYADGGQVLDCTTTNMSSNAVTFYYSSQGLVSGCTLQGNIAGRKTTGTVATRNEVYGASAEGIGFYDGSTECTISHNVIHDNYSVNLYMDSISHSLVDSNFIYESDASNDLEGIEISDEYYSDLPAPVNSYNTITNNVLYNNNLGIVFWMSDLWPTETLQNQSGLRYDVIANNTVVNSQGALKWDSSPAHVGTTLENNIFVAAPGTNPLYLLQANSAGGISLDHDLWYAPDISQPFLWVGNQTDHADWVTATSEGAGDVLSDPLFAVGETWTAPPPTGFELTSASPAVHAGVTLSSVPDDFLGDVRPSGAYDLGAFQYGAQPAPDGGASSSQASSAATHGGVGVADGGGGGGDGGEAVQGSGSSTGKGKGDGSRASGSGSGGSSSATRVSESSAGSTPSAAPSSSGGCAAASHGSQTHGDAFTGLLLAAALGLRRRRRGS
jgi:MYXO-CTERM domain-containing protein